VGRAGEVVVMSVRDDRRRNGLKLLLRVGGVAAIVGSVLQVGVGTATTTLSGGDVEALLRSITGQPGWLLPAIYLGFIFGALFWVGAMVALAAELTEGAAWALQRLALAGLIVGVTLHAVDGTLHGVALASLASAWAAAPEGERAALAQNGALLLRILDGTWAGVITLFHGAPFVLAGLAVTVSGRYPGWLGWIGFIGGAGSLVVGLALFFGAAPAGLAVPFAVILSAFMVVLGWFMWSHADAA
jgi:hypothetical protein